MSFSRFLGGGGWYVVAVSPGTWGQQMWAEILPILVGIFAVVGALATGYAIFLGINLAKATDESKRSEAKKRITSTLAGLFIIVILFSLMTVPGPVGPDGQRRTFLETVLVGTTDRVVLNIPQTSFSISEVTGGRAAQLRVLHNGRVIAGPVASKGLVSGGSFQFALQNHSHTINGGGGSRPAFSVNTASPSMGIRIDAQNRLTAQGPGTAVIDLVLPDYDLDTTFQLTIREPGVAAPPPPQPLPPHAIAPAPPQIWMNGGFGPATPGTRPPGTGATSCPCGSTNAQRYHTDKEWSTEREAVTAGTDRMAPGQWIWPTREPRTMDNRRTNGYPWNFGGRHMGIDIPNIGFSDSQEPFRPVCFIAPADGYIVTKEENRKDPVAPNPCKCCGKECPRRFRWSWYVQIRHPAPTSAGWEIPGRDERPEYLDTWWIIYGNTGRRQGTRTNPGAWVVPSLLVEGAPVKAGQHVGTGYMIHIEVLYQGASPSSVNKRGAGPAIAIEDHHKRYHPLRMLGGHVPSGLGPWD